MAPEVFPVRWAGSLAVVTLPDEVDMVNIGELRAGLASLIRAAPTVVVVDMTRTTFCDSACVATLVRAAQQASSAGIRLRLAGSAPVLRVLRLLEADRIIEVHSSLAAALGEVTSRTLPGAGLGSGAVSGQPAEASPPDEGGQATSPR
jgi:anti-sigma B factor antagonist